MVFPRKPTAGSCNRPSNGYENWRRKNNRSTDGEPPTHETFWLKQRPCLARDLLGRLPIKAPIAAQPIYAIPTKSSRANGAGCHTITTSALSSFEETTTRKSSS